MSKRKSCGSGTRNTEIDDWNWDQMGGTWVIQKCIPDPALDMNPRILANLLRNEENYLSVNYFKNGTQKDVKPWMRRMVTTWMLEVKYITNLNQINKRQMFYIFETALYVLDVCQVNLQSLASFII